MLAGSNVIKWYNNNGVASGGHDQGEQQMQLQK